MDLTSLIESAKQLSRQYERNAMNAEVVIEKISGFNQDALALQWNGENAKNEQNLQTSTSSGADGDSAIDGFDNDSLGFAMTVKRKRVLLEAVKRDSNQLRALYDHNQQLKETLSDYQLGLELIMSKYRNNIMDCLEGAERLFELEKSTLNSVSDDVALQNDVIALTDQVESMRNVLAEQVIASNTDILNQQASELHQLKIEFDTLRELCEISRKYGSDTSNRPSSRTDTPDTVIEK